METYVVAMLGESGVGKSALLMQLVMESFVGYDNIRGQTARKQLTVDDQLCVLDFVELSTEVGRSGLSTHCQAFVLVYSITERSSFTQLERCYNDMMRARRGAPTFILVGNKADKDREREVAIVEGRQRAIAWGCAFFETSAKTGLGVEEAFTRVVRELRRTVVEKPEVAKEPGYWGGCVNL